MRARYVLSLLSADVGPAALPHLPRCQPICSCCPKSQAYLPGHSHRQRRIAEFHEDWRRLDDSLEAPSAEIESLCENDVENRRVEPYGSIGASGRRRIGAKLADRRLWV